MDQKIGKNKVLIEEYKSSNKINFISTAVKNANMMSISSSLMLRALANNAIKISLPLNLGHSKSGAGTHLQFSEMVEEISEEKVIEPVVVSDHIKEDDLSQDDVSQISEEASAPQSPFVFTPVNPVVPASVGSHLQFSGMVEEISEEKVMDSVVVSENTKEDNLPQDDASQISEEASAPQSPFVFTPVNPVVPASVGSHLQFSGMVEEIAEEKVMDSVVVSDHTKEADLPQDDASQISEEASAPQPLFVFTPVNPVVPASGQNSRFKFDFYFALMFAGAALAMVALVCMTGVPPLLSATASYALLGSGATMFAVGLMGKCGLFGKTPPPPPPIVLNAPNEEIAVQR